MKKTLENVAENEYIHFVGLGKNSRKRFAFVRVFFCCGFFMCFYYILYQVYLKQELEMPLIGPKGTPVKKTVGKKYRPSDLAIKRTMMSFFSAVYGIKRDSVSQVFSRSKKSLCNFDDCVEFLRKGGTFLEK